MLDADELEARYSGMPMLLAEFGALDVDGNGFLDKDELAHQEERHIDPHKDKAGQHAAPADAHAAPADAHDAASRTADHSRHSKDAAAAGHGVPTGTAAAAAAAGGSGVVVVPESERPTEGSIDLFEFDALDANHDGILEPTELNPHHYKAHLAAEFKRIDTNGDGQLEKSELKARYADPLLQSAFAALDTNGDGFLEEEEMAHESAGHAAAATPSARQALHTVSGKLDEIAARHKAEGHHPDREAIASYELAKAKAESNM